MGLKTKNYTIEKSGLFLEDAYAVVKNISANRGHATATIAVSNNRYNAIYKEPLEEIKVEFNYNIDVDNIVSKAYEAAKGAKIVKEYDWEKQMFVEYEVPEAFSDWENDYYGVTDE